MLGLFIYIVAASVLDLAVMPFRKGWKWLTPTATGARLVTFALVYSVWLGVFGRVWLATLFSLGTISIPCIASNIKRRILGEPLTFADLHLIGQVLAHPKLYYGDFVTHRRGLTCVALTCTLSAIGVYAWLLVELPAISWPYRLGSLSLAPILIALLRLPPLSRQICTLLDAPAHAETPDSATRDWGLFVPLLAQWMRWKNDAAKIAAKLPRKPAKSKRLHARNKTTPHIVAWQSESFVHPRRYFGLSQTLHHFDQASRDAVLSGTLTVPAGGAYTMRTEFAFLTGLREEQLGLDRFNPYLRCDRWPVPSLPRTLQRHGYRTEFIHPHDLRFFRRDRVMPAMGFESCFGDEAFDGAERCGPYVSDQALALFVNGRLESADAPTFLFAVSMENHGPWPTNRLSREHTEPRDVYLHHQRNADQAIAMLLDSFRKLNRPVVFCFYGDHPPLLPPGMQTMSVPHTEYFLHVTSGEEGRAASNRNINVSSLSGALLRETARTARNPALQVPLAA
jgi:hypothetical protein